ncbi:leucine--tRNA ligase [Texas Phoenix palm phytoplasma]|uniref:Leucine--tRNA ligase n=1 Tax=Texas Phoenix palm phytoplasma TaxID=176709 RepID=A0ABS5BIK6_9MOLU|nr:leucine--tRNA ligase [Texas Phoenix palm phytoplasma]MBP3059424.1 leucine--tRNA ligase [Texas Phoenix palm phytoplasma]
MLIYDFKKIESKWQFHWKNNKIFKTKFDLNKKKFYCLDMFPYPSSSGLHVGHIEGYTASDIVNRVKRMQGYSVFHPFGFDSFGLPAEQYALKTGNNPREFTYENIENFKKQIELLGKGVDWETEIATSDPYFYKWTQWIFKKFYEHKIAVLKDVEVNFCKELGTVLANEEVIKTSEGFVSERGNFPVFRKKMKQWVLKINNYVEPLLEELENLDWPSQIKEIQKNWIGKQEGFIFNFEIDDSDGIYLSVFTTKPNTIFGVNALILAPEHYLIKNIVTKEFSFSVNEYINQIARKSDLERSINYEKTGVFTGCYAINPFNRKKIPIWISDYVLSHVGTGAIMSVPFCDKRDFLFSQKYNLEIIRIFENKKIKNKNNSKQISNYLVNYEKEKDNFCESLDEGFFINSEFLNGLNNEEAHKKIIEIASKKKFFFKNITYQIHDILFSRQRYWGEPFPLRYDRDNNIYLENDEFLPIELPFLEKIEVSGDGTSPLSKVTSWLYFKENGINYKRDSNTMPQFAGSSWYYIAYILKKFSLNCVSDLKSIKAKKLLDYFLPVDLYIGGKEHSVGHLIYARFWHKFLFDLGIVSCKEPFQKLVNQGMILGHDKLKMSKSKNNSVNATLVLEKYGSDVIRLYIMFLGPLEDDKIWNENGIKGIQRFLNKVYKVCFNFVSDKENLHLSSELQKTICLVTEYYEKLKFNKVISQLMIFINKVFCYEQISHEQIRIFLQLLNPIAPHLTEELNQKVLNNKEELVFSEWPSFLKEKFNFSLSKENKEIIIQINGKFKTKLYFDTNNINKETILKEALKNDKILNYIKKEKEIKKVIYISNKLLNLVI